MGTKPKTEVTRGSRAIIDRCRQLIVEKGISIDDFLEKTGMSRNYWYKRYRYEAPLNTTDIEHIADVLGVAQLDIYNAVEGINASDVSSDVADVLSRLDMGVAAYKGTHKFDDDADQPA